jgi:hypothetical protein
MGPSGSGRFKKAAAAEPPFLAIVSKNRTFAVSEKARRTRYRLARIGTAAGKRLDPFTGNGSSQRTPDNY